MASLATATFSTSSSMSHPYGRVSSMAQLRSYLSKLMRVAIGDGRIFIGNFACIDKDRNLVLVNTEEFRIGSNGVGRVPEDVGRYVGMVMIPWKYVVSAEAEPVDENLYT